MYLSLIALWRHVQGSPNMANPKKETFRHAIAVTGWRSGLKGTPFLYTLNLSCPDENWGKYGEMLQQAAATFKLNDPGKVISLKACRNISWLLQDLTLYDQSVVHVRNYL